MNEEYEAARKTENRAWLQYVIAKNRRHVLGGLNEI